MTCIVAIAQNGVVYMASDHAASDDKTGWILSRKEPKVLKMVSMELHLQTRFAWVRFFNTCGLLQNIHQLKQTLA